MSQNAQAIAAIFNMLPSALADATTSTTPSPPNYGAPFLLWWLIAYATRRRPIGGWLMLYYVGLYLGGIVSIVLIATTIGNLAPTQWAGVPGWKYGLAILSTLLPTAALAAQVVVGTRLLYKRTPEMLQTFRRVLLIFVAANVLALATDLTAFKSDRAAAPIDIYSLVVGSIWLAYFYKSARVRAVFMTRTWTYPDDQGGVTTNAAELKYVKKRAWITFGVIFALFTIFGWFLDHSARGLVVGLVYGALTGAIGGFIARYLSLSKSRREKIAAHAISADRLTVKDSPPGASGSLNDPS